MINNILQAICHDLERGTELITSSNIPLVVKSNKLEYLACNREMLEILNMVNEKSLVGKHDTNLPWADTYAEQFKKEDEMVLKHNAISGSCFFKIDDALCVSISYSKMPLVNASNDVIGVLSNVISINKFYSSIRKQKDDKSKKHFLRINKRIVSLSGREQECLYYLLRGMTVDMISEKLGVASSVVNTFLDRIKNKFGCHYKNEIITMALSAGAFSMIPCSAQDRD